MQKNNWIPFQTESSKGEKADLEKKNLPVWRLSHSLWRIKLFTHSKKKGRFLDVTKAPAVSIKFRFFDKYSRAGRTICRWFFVPNLLPQNTEGRVYSRKLSRLRQAILAGGLVTFFLLAFISGRISAKGDWAEFSVKDQLNYRFDDLKLDHRDDFSSETASPLAQPPFKSPTRFFSFLQPSTSIKKGYRLDEFGTSSQTIVTRLNLKKKRHFIIQNTSRVTRKWPRYTPLPFSSEGPSCCRKPFFGRGGSS